MAKYDALREHLEVSDLGPIEMTFTEIERLVGPLPPSARTRPQWWGNEIAGTHVQARSWMDANREVIALDLNAAIVSFSAHRAV